MSAIDVEALHRLGRGESIESVRAFTKMSADEFDQWWNGQLSSRVPDMAGTRRVEGAASVEILRDQWGIPHVFADSDGRRVVLAVIGEALVTIVGLAGLRVEARDQPSGLRHVEATTVQEWGCDIG